MLRLPRLAILGQIFMCTFLLDSLYIIQIGETEHADFEKGLMQSLHSLQVKNKDSLVSLCFMNFVHSFIQDQYDKLLQDYQAVSRDRGFMEESMTALKKRNEQLVSKLQQCEVWFYYA